MILYNLTINIEKAVAVEWLNWIKEIYIPKIMKTGLFLENKIFRLLNEEDNGGITYAIQFYASSLANIQNYQINFAPALQAEHNERFADQFVEFMTLLEAEKL
jgi:hypothetical protein